MYAIVTILDESSNAVIQALWQELEDQCGLSAIRIFPIPHFSWQGADRYDLSSVEKSLDQIASNTSPLVVRADGLGIFTGPDPVIYIPLAKNPSISRLHQTIWRQVKKTAIGLSPLYAPELWMPHITLGMLDVNQENLGCAVRVLANRPLLFEIKVNNLALVSQEGDQVGGLQSRFNFKGDDHG
ncbi:MAG TPA: 2'-5' RNA ligase family protein [Anaerolineaceae bacterium]|jgi:2'-5' RNA ligase